MSTSHFAGRNTPLSLATDARWCLAVGFSLHVPVICHRLLQLFTVKTDGPPPLPPNLPVFSAEVSDAGAGMPMTSGGRRGHKIEATATTGRVCAAAVDLTVRRAVPSPSRRLPRVIFDRRRRMCCSAAVVRAPVNLVSRGSKMARDTAATGSRRVLSVTARVGRRPRDQCPRRRQQTDKPEDRTPKRTRSLQ